VEAGGCALAQDDRDDEVGLRRLALRAVKGKPVPARARELESVGLLSRQRPEPKRRAKKDSPRPCGHLDEPPITSAQFVPAKRVRT